MATVWQRLKHATGMDNLQSLNFVTTVLNKNYYRDLAKENEAPDGDECPVKIGQEQDDSPEIDQADAGVGVRRKYIMILNNMEETETDSVSVKQKGDEQKETEQPCQDCHSKEGDESLQRVCDVHDSDNLSCQQNHERNINSLSSERNSGCHDADHDTSYLENNRNEALEKQTHSLCSENSGSNLLMKDQPVQYRRIRRDSYDRALTEMRDSYDRIFTDVVQSQDRSVSEVGYITDSASKINRNIVNTSSENYNNQLKGEFTFTQGTQPMTVQSKNSTTKPLRKQLSAVIQQDIPKAIGVIRQRSYSKLGEDQDEIEVINSVGDTTNSKWHESFPVPQKTKISGRKRSKKAWKRTKKAFRISWKWLRRSLMAYNSSFNYGIPMNVAMYGGSQTSGRRAYYDYR